MHGIVTNHPYSDFADEFTKCEVIGTDISPIQPSGSRRISKLLVLSRYFSAPLPPPRLSDPQYSEIEDCTQEWTFRENDFDFVHIRYLVGSIVDWNAFFKQAYNVLKPGGWLESVEPDPTFKAEGPPLPEGSAVASGARYSKPAVRL